jgi:hypothetical protein
MAKQVTVLCYAGYKGEERPTSFRLAERTIQVEEVVDRWYDVDYSCFKVLAADGTSCLLRHDLNTDLWELSEGETT